MLTEPELETKTLERPDQVVFFKPFNYTEEFWQAHQELFREPSGVVFERQVYSDPDNTVLAYNETLLLDATKRESSEFTWQYTRANHGECEIDQLVVTKGGVISSHIATDHQGRLVRKEDGINRLSIEDIVFTITLTPGFQQRVANLIAVKEKARSKLTDFEENGEADIHFVQPGPDGPIHTTKRVKVFGEVYEKHLKQHKTAVENVGFTVMKAISLD